MEKYFFFSTIFLFDFQGQFLKGQGIFPYRALTDDLCNFLNKTRKEEPDLSKEVLVTFLHRM